MTVAVRHVQGGPRASRRGRTAAAALLTILLCALLAGCTGNMAPITGPGRVSGGGAYTVQRGDTLYSIAWRNGLDFRAVARWNRIEPPYLIYPGQRLRLSIPDQARSVRKPAPPTRSRPVVRPARKSAPPAAPAAPAEPAGGAPAWRWPAAGTLTRRFAADAQGKQGVELSGSLGDAVSAAAPGRVVYAGGGLRGYGNLVIVKHSSRFLTAYGYNQTLLVKEGEQVSAGQRIATMGLGPSRKPALHFEIRRDGKPVDPLRYLPER